MKAIYLREVRACFTNMTGCVFIAVVTFFIGIYFMANNLYYGYPQFSYALLNGIVVFLVAVPILTMRSMAEERRARTDQLLLSAPVSLTGVVLGKYFSMLTVLAIPMGLFCLCPLIIAANGTGQLASDYASILAFFLMGCVFAAVGMFLSSLTESQVIAAVSTFAALLALYLWDDLMDFLPDALAGLLSRFSFSSVLYNFAYYSVFDVGGVVLYLSLSGLFVFLTVQALQKRRWLRRWPKAETQASPGRLPGSHHCYRGAIVIFINLIVGQLPTHLLEFDLSDKQLYTVTDTSRELLAGLDKDVEIVVLAEESNVDERIAKFLDNYAALSGHITVTEVDPVAHPSAAESYNAAVNSLVVRCEETGKARAISFDDIIVYDQMYYYMYGQIYETEFDAEGQLTSAVDYVTGDNDTVIYTMENHDETALSTQVTDAIEKANLTLDSTSLLLTGSVPEDCSLLISYGASKDLTDDELTLIRAYLDGGGQVMFVLAQTEEEMPNWETLMAVYGLSLADGYVADTARYYPQLGSVYAIAPVFLLQLRHQRLL